MGPSLKATTVPGKKRERGKPAGREYFTRSIEIDHYHYQRSVNFETIFLHYGPKMRAKNCLGKWVAKEGERKQLSLRQEICQKKELEGSKPH